MSEQPISRINFKDQSGFNSGAGKGDAERPVNRAKYRSNYDAINWSKNKTFLKQKKPV